MAVARSVGDFPLQYYVKVAGACFMVSILLKLPAFREHYSLFLGPPQRVKVVMCRWELVWRAS